MSQEYEEENYLISHISNLTSQKENEPRVGGGVYLTSHISNLKSQKEWLI